jgi:ribonuclease BN (tRNA processing enzyme)
MKLHVLGCSAVELPNSRLSSFLIDGRLLLDAGTIGSVLDEKEQLKIKHILLTHAHLDHIKDLPFFADNIAMNNRSHQVTVISIPEVIHALRANLFNDVVWPDFTKMPSPRAPIIRLESITPNRTIKVNGYRVTAHLVNHSVPAVGYVIENTSGEKLLYMGDTGPNEELWKSLNGKHMSGIIIEVSLPTSLRNIALKTGHLTPGLLVKELGKMRTAPDTIYITHAKPMYRKKVQEELKKLDIKNMKILRDGDVYEI